MSTWTPNKPFLRLSQCTSSSCRLKLPRKSSSFWTRVYKTPCAWIPPSVKPSSIVFWISALLKLCGEGSGISACLSDRAVVSIDKQSMGAAEVVVRNRVWGVVWAIGVEMLAKVVVLLVLLDEHSAGTHCSSSSLWWTWDGSLIAGEKNYWIDCGP